MPSTGDRGECPHCGKDVAVNMDGTLRKHECIEVDGEQVSVEPKTEVDEQPVAEVDDGECACEPKPDPEPAVRPVEHRKDARLCSVPGCDRPNVLHRVCGAHYASRRGG